MTRATTRLWLVRHGQTDWNLERRIQGSSDIPLNDTGREQARAVAAGITAREAEPREPGSHGWDGVYASRLSRASETAAIIADALGLPAPEIVPGLEERSYGQAEGLTGPEISARFGDDRSTLPGWETDAALLGRVLPALTALAEAHEGEELLVVVHGGVIGAVVRAVTAGERPQPGEAIGNGSLHEFDYADGALSLLRFNLDAAELAEPVENVA